MGPAAKLQLEFQRLAQIRQYPATWWRDVLAIVQFGPDASTLLSPEVPTARVLLPVLSGDDVTAEVWRLAGPMSSGQHGRVHYRRNAQLLFATVSVQEAQLSDEHGASGAGALREATQIAYRELFAALSSQGFEHPLRIWNYLPQINGENPDGERYWEFNSARQAALVGVGRETAGNVPAASALGANGASPLTIYCIASTSAPIALENPRQRSAWNYPVQYGPKSPIFARACIESDPAQTLFISGTASIVGHESAHAGDVRAQTLETLRNVRAVLAAANARVGAQRYALEQLSYKVYVRRPEDLAAIEAELRPAIGPAAVLYLNADICRRELLVELEAVGT